MPIRPELDVDVNTYTPERVTLELSREEFAWLGSALSYAAVCAEQSEPLFPMVLRLANAINRGNPNWTPYEVPEAKT